MTVVELPGFPRPSGYSNGILAEGRVLAVAGQIGWDARCKLVAPDFVPQLSQALANVVAVVRAAGGDATSIVSLTIYVTDVEAYRTAGKPLGEAFRSVMGKHYPAMALVGVTELVERGAKVEVSALAVIEAKP